MLAMTEFKMEKTGMQFKNVSADQFRNHIGDYLNGTGETPVVITESGRSQWVFIRFNKLEEYEQLKVHDTRVAFYASELPDEDAAAFAGGYKGRATPEYD